MKVNFTGNILIVLVCFSCLPNTVSAQTISTTLNLTAPITNTNIVHKATSTITANNEISNSNVTYEAGSSITLKSGFTVKSGSTFTAKIVSASQLRISQELVTELPDEEPFTMTAYPNPFEDDTQIEYWLPKASKVTLVVYDQKGIELSRLLDNESQPYGKHKVTFQSKHLSSGFYNCFLSTDDSQKVHRVFKK